MSNVKKVFGCVLSLTLLGTFVLMTPAASLAGEAPVAVETPEQQAGQAAQIPAGGAASRAYLDPATGRLGAPPAGAIQPLGETVPLSPNLQNALSTSDVGLVTEPVPAERGGGYVVHLQGRFRSATVATMGPDGKLTTHRIGAAPSAAR